MAVSPKAIVIGGVTDVVLSGLLGIPFALYVMWSNGLLRLPKEQLSQATVSAVHGSAALMTAQIAIGLACSAVGGYVAARVAQASHVLNGVLASWLCVGIGVYTLAFGRGDGAPATHLLMIGATPIAYYLGARLCMRLKIRSGA